MCDANEYLKLPWHTKSADASEYLRKQTTPNGTKCIFLLSSPSPLLFLYFFCLSSYFCSSRFELFPLAIYRLLKNSLLYSSSPSSCPLTHSYFPCLLPPMELMINDASMTLRPCDFTLHGIDGSVQYSSISTSLSSPHGPYSPISVRITKIRNTYSKCIICRVPLCPASMTNG